MAWSPDGRLAVATAGSAVTVIDGSAGRNLFSLEETDQRKTVCIAWSPDGKEIASCGFFTPVMVSDGSSGKQLRTLGQRVTRLAWAPDGGRIAAGDGRTVSIHSKNGTDASKPRPIAGDLLLGWRTDPDRVGTFTYTLVSGSGSADNAVFNIFGSQLRATATLDFEMKNLYSVRIRSTDQGGLSTEKAFTITVTNVNEAPGDIALSAATVAENSPAGTAVGTLSATDVDAGDTLTYALVPGTGGADNASFTIVGNVLTAAATFNFEARNSYSVRVRATDAGGLFTEKSFTIAVTNVNEVPTDITLTPATIAENNAVGANPS
jgi:WD40 repeat protein